MSTFRQTSFSPGPWQHDNKANFLWFGLQQCHWLNTTQLNTKRFFSKAKKCEICVSAAIKNNVLVLPSYLRCPPAAKGHCQRAHDPLVSPRGEKKIFVSLFSAASLCLFFDVWLWVWCLWWATGQAACAHHHVYCVWNGWMDTGYLKVLVVQSCPAVPALPYLLSHLGHLDEEVNK